MEIPVKNIYRFFTKEPKEPNCEQMELHEDFLNDIIEFHFENGLIIGFYLSLQS